MSGKKFEFKNPDFVNFTTRYHFVHRVRERISAWKDLVGIELAKAVKLAIIQSFVIKERPQGWNDLLTETEGDVIFLYSWGAGVVLVLGKDNDGDYNMIVTAYDASGCRWLRAWKRENEGFKETSVQYYGKKIGYVLLPKGEMPKAVA